MNMIGLALCCPRFARLLPVHSCIKEVNMPTLKHACKHAFPNLSCSEQKRNHQNPSFSPNHLDHCSPPHSFLIVAPRIREPRSLLFVFAYCLYLPYCALSHNFFLLDYSHSILSPGFFYSVTQRVLPFFVPHSHHYFLHISFRRSCETPRISISYCPHPLLC